MAGAAFAALAVTASGTTQTRARSVAPPAVDASWLKSDSARSTAEVSVIAGMTAANGNMNFNGAVAGGLQVIVPLHWHVVLHFRNNDQILPHSAEVIPATDTIPESPPAPAFPRAETGRLQQGLGPDSKQDIRFTADRAGAFYVFCAVPGHGAAGMWIRLDVSPTATQASLTTVARRRG
ncbi:MAG TPA: sulfocyanin-like copper-binding protein [Gemmatimonadales bacterium]